MAGQLNNKVAIVTGAGHGMGYSIANLLASEGAKVYAFDLLFSEKMGGVKRVLLKK